METILTKYQKKTFKKYFIKGGKEYEITAKVHYDDDCGNGHNTFTITGEVWKARNGERVGSDCITAGCIHEEISNHFPELAPFIKWHLVSSDKPMHYLANTLYHFEQGKFDYAKLSCVWGVAPDDSKYAFEKMSDKVLEAYLIVRLPHVQMAFKKAIESLGFTF